MLCFGKHDPESIHAVQRHSGRFGRVSAAALMLGAIATSQAAGTAPRIAANAIAGIVTSAHGAQAGVWVIAETQDFRTRFAKIVVTDAAGRYLIPELPAAKYRVWVRGYGLVDSPGVEATRGIISILQPASRRMRRARRRPTRLRIGTR